MIYSLYCIKPTSVIPKNVSAEQGGNLIRYYGTPVRKSNPDDSYNGRYTTQWEECTLEECTSFKVKDILGINRYISKHRFKLTEY